MCSSDLCSPVSSCQIRTLKDSQTRSRVGPARGGRGQPWGVENPLNVADSAAGRWWGANPLAVEWRETQWAVGSEGTEALPIRATIRLQLSQAPVGVRGSALLAILRSLADQGEEGLEPGSVGIGGVEEDSGAKQSASILASSCLPLAFSCHGLQIGRAHV